MEVKLFGRKAEDIKPGDLFKPTFSSEEGRNIVILKKTNTFKVLLEMYDTNKISLDKLIENIRKEVEPDNA